MVNRGTRTLHAAIVFSVLVSAATALKMKTGLYPADSGGLVCGTATCSHSPSDEQLKGVQTDKIKLITFELLNDNGGYDQLIQLGFSDSEPWTEQAVKAEEYTQNFKFENKDGSIGYTVEILRDHCVEAERFACFVNDDQELWTEADKVIETDVGQDEQSVRDMDIPDASIEIITVLADAMVNLRDRLEAKAVHLENNMAEGTNLTDQKLGKFEEAFTANMRGIEIRSGFAQRVEENALKTARSGVKTSLEETSAELVEKLNELESGATSNINNMITVIDKSVGNLNTNLKDTIQLASTTSQSNLSETQSFLQDSLEALGHDVTSLGVDTSGEIRKTENDTDNRFIDVKANVENTFIRITERLDTVFVGVTNTFTGLSTNAETTLSQSLDQTSQKIDDNVKTFEKNFNNDTKTMIESVKGISERLRETSTTTEESLVSSLNTNDEVIIEKLSNVQTNLGQSVTSLQNDITTQGKSTNDLIKNAAKHVNDVVTESKSTVLTRNEDFHRTITTAITDVDKSVTNGQTDLKSNLYDFNTSMDEVIPNAGEAVTRVLGSLDQHLSTGIDEASQKVSSGLQDVTTQLSSSSQDNSQKTEQAFLSVQGKLLDQVNTLNIKLENHLDAHEQSSQVKLNVMKTAVGTNMDRVKADVEYMDSRVTAATNRLASTVDNATADAEKTVSDTIQLFQSNVANRIDELAGNTNAKVSTLSSKLSNSVSEVETESLSSLGSFKGDVKTTLDNLLAESDGISKQVGRLGDEITTQQDKTTALNSKLDGLTDTLRSPIGENTDQISLNLDNYIKTQEEDFVKMNSDFTEKARDTAALLDGVNDKIKNMTGVMETALSTLHEDVTELGQDIQTVGTNVTGFLNINIGELFDNMVAGTKVITSYLQPRTCERNMNYASISNNKYVVIAPNEDSHVPFNILCDTSTLGGGWIVIQKRVKNSLPFYKNWDAYKQGFGSLDSDFYMGNDRIHNLTAEHEYELMVVVTWDQQEYTASYDSFSIDDEANKYTLHVGAFSGTAGDSLSYHNNIPFSTNDRDNDNDRRTSCARRFMGGWWYDSCMNSNLNGRWGDLRWYTLAASGSVANSEMKIRRK